MNKRRTGSYYTPQIISDFIVRHVLNKHSGKKLIILEPSAGDGVFIQSLFNEKFKAKGRLQNVLAIELNKSEIEIVRSRTQSEALKVRCDDFLQAQANLSDGSFDIVLGNPPYIKKSLLSADQVEWCHKIHEQFPDLGSKYSIKNIWSAFLVRSISLLKDNGILSLVLPAELLQVNFTAELRGLLMREFARIEILTFNDLLFKECKGQDTLILIAEKKSSSPGLFFRNVRQLKDLEKEAPRFVQMKYDDKSKWTSHCLSKAEIQLLEKLRTELKAIDHYCDSKTGIVTGANEFFIVNKEIVKDYRLKNVAKPILQKGGFVKSWLKFTKGDYENLTNQGNPCYLLDLNNVKIKKSSLISSYIEEGEARQINLRYKSRIRDKWYEVPGIGEPAKGLFFKRCHDFPKFISNKAEILATDSAYEVTPKAGFNIDFLTLSFYNSLTLIFAELGGRFYGGGVLELTPNEFKKIPIPYNIFNAEDLSKYQKYFHGEAVIGKAVDALDNYLLKKSIPKITNEEILSLKKIREKLVSRRQRL